ncbi:Serpin family [Trema orientale]|uniref:Serpin family n=1 Tax=Trema orientale TaxID=63057 RepID=A0A2P5FZU1_TREOI|nr:Serpin family [Trema orientale]
MEMSMEIMKQFLLNENELHSNFVFSPLSINTLLSIVANGLEAGPSLDTLLSLLGIKTLADLKAKACTDHLTSLKTDDGPQLSSVNGFWIDKKYRLNPSFEKVLETIYKADSSTVDFENKPMETVDKINTWVLDATKGLIRNLLKYEAVKKETTLILANALYFKGAWDSPFDPSSIRTQNFYVLNGDVVQVPYMCESDLERGSFASSDEGFKVLRIPYENNLNSKKGGAGEKFAMYIFLPNDNDGLLNLLDKISSNPCLLDLQLTDLEPTYYIRKLKIPKFKFQFKFQLSDIMERLGVRMVKAEMLEALSSDDNIPYPINDDIDIIHSSCIDVNEHGTEAAAVTYEESMGFSLDSSPRIDIDFVADHPFMFMIREDTLGTPIFLGAVVNPLLE